jgi:hypothetical protein
MFAPRLLKSGPYKLEAFVAAVAINPFQKSPPSTADFAPPTTPCAAIDSISDAVVASVVAEK